MKVLVIGANGNTGTRIIRMLQDSSHEPVAMIRNPSQKAKFDALNVPSALGDLEYPIDDAIKGNDAVIFAAGSGGQTGKDKTVLVDHIGAIRAMVTAQLHGARRFIMLSSLNADVNSRSPIAHYHKAKGHADHHLQETDLHYTIVCPGRLTDEPGTGRIAASGQLFGRGHTSRENLAQVLVACLDRDHTIGKRFALLDGDTPLDEALDSI